MVVDKIFKIKYILYIKYIDLKLTYWMEVGKISMTALRYYSVCGTRNYIVVVVFQSYKTILLIMIT